MTLRSRVVLRPIRSTVPVVPGAAVADRVAAAERPVEHDRQRGEQVGENALRGEADGDAADAEAGDQRGDVDAEIVEDDDDRDGEHRDADQHADDRHGIAERRAARILADAAADHADDDLARPDRGLEGRGDDEQYVGQAGELGRHVGVGDDDVDRRRDHEEDAGLRQGPGR